MYKFKGTINGVEYTDRKAFFEALRTQKDNQKYNVTIHEVRDDAESALKEIPAEKQEPVLKHEDTPKVQENKYNELFDMLGDMFVSFLKAQNPTLYKKLVGAVEQDEEPDEPQKQKCTKQVSDPNEYKGTQSEFNRILEKYFFKDTTYEFTGGVEDEFHLDRFAGLLHSLENEIKNECMKLNKAQKKVLYTRTLSEFARIRKEIGKIDDTLTVTDRQLAGLEKVISSYREIDFKVPSEITNSYEEQKHAFNSLRNRNDYYQLLVEYYRKIGPYFDPEH